MINMRISDSHSTSPSICIVLINWNQLQLTLDCLDSLFAMSYKNFKVIVVDNDSKENPTDKINQLFPEVVVLRQNTNLGFAEGNNVGFRYAYTHDFEYIMALNNDTIVDPDFLWPLVDTFSQSASSLAAVSPKIYFKHAPKTIWALGGKVSNWRVKGYSYKRKTPDEGQFETDIEPDYLTGCCILIKTTILRSLGGFNKDYFAYYEDTDLSYRLKKKGYKIKVIAKSIIWHVAGGSSRGNKKKPPFLTFLGTRNRIMFFRSHFLGFKYFYITIYLLISTLSDALFYLLTFRKSHFIMLLKGLKEGFSYTHDLDNSQASS